MDIHKILFIFISKTLDVLLGFIYFYLIRIVFDIGIVGHYSVLISFFLTFSFILDLGFGIAYLKYYSEASNTEEKASYNSTFILLKVIQLSAYVILILMSIPLIKINIENIVIIYALFFGRLLSIIGNISSPLFYSEKNVNKYSIPMIISTLLRIILIILIVNLPNKDIWLLTNIIIISNLLYLGLILMFLKNIKIEKPNIKIIKKFLLYSYPFAITYSLFLIVNNIDVLLINSFCSTNEVANYYTAKQIYTYFLLFVPAFSNILISTFSKNISLKNSEKNILIIKKIHKILNLFITPIVFLGALYSTKLIVFIFGENYRLTGSIFSLYLFMLIPITFHLANTIQLQALGDIKFLNIMDIFKISLILIFYVIFIFPDFYNMGSTGAVLALILAELITQIIFRPILYKKYNLGFYWGSFRNFIIMLVIFIIQLYINTYFPISIFFIPVFIFFNIGTYFLLNYLFKGFSRKDLKFIFEIFNFEQIKKTYFSEFKKK